MEFAPTKLEVGMETPREEGIQPVELTAVEERVHGDGETMPAEPIFGLVDAKTPAHLANRTPASPKGPLSRQASGMTQENALGSKPSAAVGELRDTAEKSEANAGKDTNEEHFRGGLHPLDTFKRDCTTKSIGRG